MTIKKKSKKIDHNKALLERTKNSERYDDLLFLKQVPVTEAFIDRLCVEMAVFADEEHVLRPSQFWNEKRWHSADIYRWKARWPQLQRAYDYLMAMCAQRRDLGAITRKYDGSYIEKSQAMYDPEYKALLEWRASVADKNKEASGTLIVQMVPAPNSGKVPERKKMEGQVDVE